MQKITKNVNLKKVSCYSNAELLQLKKILTDSFTFKHSGKMENMISVSTSCLENPYCLLRRKLQPLEVDGEKIPPVCLECYAAAQLEARETNRDKFKRNIELWTKQVLPLEALPDIYNKFFRFESFGDLFNPVHALNYINLAKKNDHVDCALWTKNVFILKKVFETEKKPKNLNVIESSLYFNDEIKKSYDFIDKTFVVYTGNYAKKHDIKINCGKKICIDCGICYGQNSIDTLRELVKSDQRKKAYKSLLEY